MRRRGLLLLFTVGALVGCGSETTAPSEDPGLESPPPIQTVDEPAPEAAPGFVLDMTVPPECEEDPALCEGEDGCFRASNRDGEEERWSGKCTPEEVEALKKLFREETMRFEPASDSEPRVVARLPLTGPEHADLVVWRTQAGKLCFLAAIHPTLERNGPMGPCDASGLPACPEICLAMLDSVGLTLVGTVDPKADEISFDLNDGERRRFPLAGPLVPGFEQRIFMAHLGRKSLHRIELFQAGERTAHYTRPATEVRADDCERRFDADDAGFQTCLEQE